MGLKPLNYSLRRSTTPKCVRPARCEVCYTSPIASELISGDLKFKNLPGRAHYAPPPEKIPIRSTIQRVDTVILTKL